MSELGNDSAFDSGYITSYSDKVCIRPSSDRAIIDFQSNLQDGGSRLLGKSSLSLNYQSSNPIQRVRFFLDDKEIRNIRVDVPNTSGSIKTDYSFLNAGTYAIKVTVVDIYGFSATQTSKITFGAVSNPPAISVTNPANKTINLYEGQTANLRFTVVDPVEISSVNLYMDGKLYKILGTNSTDYVVAIGDGLTVGKYSIEIRANSVTKQKSSEMIEVEILK